MTTPWYGLAFGTHYSDLYEHRDHSEADRCINTVAELVAFDGRDVLDLGCGSGRHFLTLKAHGAHITGVDYSSVLLAEATSCRSTDAHLVRGDWFELGLRAAQFDVVLSLFTAFGYGDHPVDQQRMLSEIGRILRPTGVWVLDYLNPRLVRRELATPPEPRERRIKGAVVRDVRRLNADRSRVEKTVTIVPDADQVVSRIPLVYTESVALLDLDELDAMAAVIGLKRMASCGDYDGAKLDPETSPRWLLIYGREESS